MSKSSRVEASRRWTAEQARAVLVEQERSGLSVARFAQRRGLSAERLYRWRRNLRDSATSPAFVEVAREETEGALEIVLRNGHRVVVRGGANATTLQAVISVLAAAC